MERVDRLQTLVFGVIKRKDNYRELGKLESLVMSAFNLSKRQNRTVNRVSMNVSAHTCLYFCCYTCIVSHPPSILTTGHAEFHKGFSRLPEQVRCFC